MPRDDDDDEEPQPKAATVKKKDLKKRIEGFGSDPRPADDDEDDTWFGSGGQQDLSFGGWYDSARASVNSMLDAVDDTVNAIADAVDDTIAAVIGEDDDEEPHQDSQASGNRGKGGDDGSRGGDTPGKKKKKPKEADDTGERSGTDWPTVVDAICVGGDCEEFVLKVRSQIKNEFEEREVGTLVAESLLNEVKAQGTLRILHVLQAVVSDGNLPHAEDMIRSRCATKLGKLQATPCFAKIAAEVLGPGVEQGKRGEAAPQASQAKAKAAAKAPANAPVAACVDLLDMTNPNESTSASGASSAKKAQPSDLEDLIGLGGPTSAASPAAASTSPMPAISPPKATGAAPAGLRCGAVIRAKWAGDGKLYPAVVENVRGQKVNLQWVRRNHDSAKTDAFVGDVGDDTTHESCQLSDVMVGSVSAATSRQGNLVDLDTPAIAQVQQPPAATLAAPAAVPPSVVLANTLAGLNMGSSVPAAAASSHGAAGNDRFAALGAGSGLGAPQWPAAAPPMGTGMPMMGAGGGYAANPLGSGPINANFAAFPATSGPSSANFAAFPATSGPSSANFAAFPATIGGSSSFGGGAFGTMDGGAKMSAARSPATGSSGSPAKKDLGLGDAFALAGMR